MDEDRPRYHHLPPIDPNKTFLSIEPPGPSEGTEAALGWKKTGAELYWKAGVGVEERRVAAVVTGLMKGDMDSERVFEVGGKGGIEIKLGSLGPDLTGDEYMAKASCWSTIQRRYADQVRSRANLQRTNRLSRASSTPDVKREAAKKPATPQARETRIETPAGRAAKLLDRSTKKGSEEAGRRRAKMMQYASTIKKPSPPKLPPISHPSAEDEKPRRTEKYPRYEDEDGDEADGITVTELERLQEEHARNLQMVQSIKRELRIS
ncbi:hypothetical protein HDU67_005465 [Dinochytrium kinnereticum]|nr:hypothetical protein HDU67_005465 [Dinochytrium kinnereticum]